LPVDRVYHARKGRDSWETYPPVQLGGRLRVDRYGECGVPPRPCSLLVRLRMYSRC